MIHPHTRDMIAVSNKYSLFLSDDGRIASVHPHTTVIV